MRQKSKTPVSQDGFIGHIIIDLIETIIKAATNLPGNPDYGKTDKAGGYFAELNKKTGILTTIPLLYFPEEKVAKYLRYASEKATRLDKTGYRRSFTKADESREEYGGGIKYYHKIYAFSGFHPMIDEAISIIYAMTMREILIRYEVRLIVHGATSGEILVSGKQLLKDKDHVKKMVLNRAKSWQKKYAADNNFIIPLTEKLFLNLEQEC